MYEDGTEGTPLIIMKRIFAHDDPREIVLALFIDKRPKHIQDATACRRGND